MLGLGGSKGFPFVPVNDARCKALVSKEFPRHGAAERTTPCSPALARVLSGDAKSGSEGCRPRERVMFKRNSDFGLRL